MRARVPSTIASAASLILVLAIWATPGRAQPEPSPNPTVFKAQLTEASLLGKRTIRELQALPTDNATPLDPTMLGHAHQTYALIRAGRHGMRMLQERQSLKDPVLDIALKRVDAAWDLARYPIDGRFATRAEYLPRAIGDLSKAMRLVDQALMILP
jgi:hypothetical protein